MTVLKYICLLAFVLTGIFLRAQNTYGGKAIQVPEEEVKRQSIFIEAEQLRMLGRYDKAMDKYRDFLRENPENAAAWYGYSRSAFEKQQLTDALDAADKAASFDPANPWLWVHQANIYEKMGRAKDAAGVYAALSKKYPDNRHYLEQLAYFHVLASQPKEALKALDQLEKLSGLTEDIAGKKHIIYATQGDKKRAAAELQRLSDAYPNRKEYLHRLAQYYEVSGQGAEAKKTYARIVVLDPEDTVAKLSALEPQQASSEVAYLQALLPVFQNTKAPIDPKVQEIIPYFEKLNEKTAPDLVQALLDLSAILEKVHPEDPKTWSLAGDLHYHINQPEVALEKYRQCLKLGPRVFAVWENTLSILNDMKAYNELKEVAENALDIFPNQPVGYLFYAKSANALGNPDEALSMLQQALLMTGKNQALRLSIEAETANSLLVQNKNKEALEFLERKLQEGGNNHPQVLEVYGDALQRSGNRQKAVEFWQKAYTLAPTTGLKTKIDGSN